MPRHNEFNTWTRYQLNSSAHRYYILNFLMVRRKNTEKLVYTFHRTHAVSFLTLAAHLQ
jgi:hypothetical protein